MGEDRRPPSCPSQNYLRRRKQRLERSGPGPCSLPLLFLQGQRRLPVTPGGQSQRCVPGPTDSIVRRPQTPPPVRVKSQFG